MRRANALAAAFLQFRADRIQEQTTSANKALNQQIAALQQQISQLTTSIANTPQGTQLSTLQGEQSSDQSELSTLEQTVQQNQVASVGVTTGSRVVTPGTLAPSSAAKLFGLDGLAGLIGGLFIGMAYVAVQAVLSDRLRRRDEVASILGAPVELSLKPVQGPEAAPGALDQAGHAVEPQGELSALAGYMRRLGVRQEGRKTLLVVAMDDLAVPAAALAVLAQRLTDEGESVLVADLTNEGLLSRSMEDLLLDAGRQPAGVHASAGRHERDCGATVGRGTRGSECRPRADQGRSLQGRLAPELGEAGCRLGDLRSLERPGGQLDGGPAACGGDHHPVRHPDRGG